MATNGTSNGISNGTVTYTHTTRFTDIPPSIDIPVYEGGAEEAVEVDLTELLDDPTELCTLLENENVAKNYWMTIALAYAKQNDIDHAIEILTKGLAARRGGQSFERLTFLVPLCWMWLWKCRGAPRLRPEGAGMDVYTKDYYITQATATLNEAARISPSYEPLHLARGVLSLLRASILPPGRGANLHDNSERVEALRHAQKCFEDVLRLSGQRNVMATLGKARVLFTLGRYAESLQIYQIVLERAAQLTDPDPRIGIGCCLWQLGHRDDAKLAWDRALQINPDSKHANILLGAYFLQKSSQFAITEAGFAENYRKAMIQYTQKAFKLDDKLPLACSTFGGFFMTRQDYARVEKLARSAIEYTDVNAIASDGWYLLARKEHQQGNLKKAEDFYTKSDTARQADDKEKGFFPAKFGLAQIGVINGRQGQVKAELSRLTQNTRSLEALTLLGTLHAESYFATIRAGVAKESMDEVKKDQKSAITILEQVRNVWKDPKRKATVDAGVLLNLARLYERDSPDKSLQCLKQVEQIEIDAIPDDAKPTGIEDEEELRRALREMLPPPLLNNLGCFYFQAEKYSDAREMFQSALSACVKISQKDSASDSDALATTISFNLGRTHEAEGNLEEAQTVYQGVLSRHPNYSDAIARLAYIAYQLNPEEGAKEMQTMFDDDPGNVDVRVLYGWFLNRTKRRTTDFAADAEQKLHKYTLLEHVKHDPYLLTAMGNICLSIARELRGDKEKDRRAKTYDTGFSLFDSALKADPYNAYAAQGLAIAVAEHKKDLNTALQILTSVRETMRDATVYMNLGHVFAELKQFSRAIESYETALAKKDRVSEIAVLTALGRVWYMKGRSDKNLSALKNSLDYSRRVLALQPDQPHFRFNVAFVQFQIALVISSLKVQQRTLEDVETAQTDLEAAIDEFFAIAKHQHPPYPRSDIEQRGNMSRTMSKQLERALDEQKKYAAQNAERLEAAKAQRDAEVKRREEEKKVAEAQAEERRQRLLEERKAMEEQDRELAERTRQTKEEERLREEENWTTDSQTGERKKRVRVKRPPTGEKGSRRKSKKRNSEDVVSDGHLSAGEGQSDAEGNAAPRSRKKRRLERGGGASGASSRKSAAQNSKYKSSEMIVDSDEEAGPDDELPAEESDAAPTPGGLASDDEEEEVAAKPRKRGGKRVVDDDDEDEDDEAGGAAGDGDVPMRDGEDDDE